MQTGLRMVLLLIGCLIVAGIIWDYKRRPSGSTEKKNSRSATKKTLRSSKIDTEEIEAQRRDSLDSKNRPLESSLIVLHVVAKKPRLFLGPELLKAFESVYLFYGENQIFYGYQYPKAKGSNRGARLFSVLSMVEPGFFELSTMASLKSPGISLVLILDEHTQPFAFESMLKTAQALGQRLEGELREGNHQPLVASHIQGFRERVSEHLLALCETLALDSYIEYCEKKPMKITSFNKVYGGYGVIDTSNACGHSFDGYR